MRGRGNRRLTTLRALALRICDQLGCDEMMLLHLMVLLLLGYRIELLPERERVRRRWDLLVGSEVIIGASLPKVVDVAIVELVVKFGLMVFPLAEEEKLHGWHSGRCNALLALWAYRARVLVRLIVVNMVARIGGNSSVLS